MRPVLCCITCNTTALQASLCDMVQNLEQLRLQKEHELQQLAGEHQVSLQRSLQRSIGPPA